MRWLQTEYLLKGIYLGLLLFVAVQQEGQRIETIGQVALCTVGGLAVFLGVAAGRELIRGQRIQGRSLAFFLYLILENPTLVFAGVLLGTTIGASTLIDPATRDPQVTQLVYCVAGGAILGVIFGQLRDVKAGRPRVILGGVLLVALVVGGIYLFGDIEGFKPERPLKPGFLTGLQLLVGIPFFYLLTLASREEETEIEIGAMSALLGVALLIMVGKTTQAQGIAILVPILLYVVYTKYVLAGLRVFKHVLRGVSHAEIGRYRQALLCFQRAVKLDPHHALARKGLWTVYRKIDVVQLATDPETRALIDFDLCLERAGSLLLAPAPAPEVLQEAHRLLDLVQSQRPDMKPRVNYWRAVAHTHVRDYDAAVAELLQVLEPKHVPARDPQRQAALMPAWQLALTLSDELRRRVGQPQLAVPGRRMEAIAAVERHLADHADDHEAWNLKRQLYHELTEADYDAGAKPGQAARHFDHDYVRQLGLTLIDDPTRWQRGVEYLRLAARGLPANAPTIFAQIAQAYQRTGDTEGAWRNYELVKRAGQAAGPANLPDEDRLAYFNTLKLLGETARARGNLDAAIEDYRLYTEADNSGIETRRILTQLYEDKGNVLAALWFTEQGLLYNGKDADLLERKDRYYYSVTPHDLKANLESMRNAFDTAYCVKKARSVLANRSADLDLLDWAQHLLELALVVEPNHLTARLLLGQAKLRRGERAEAVAVLESVHSPKPEKFASSEEEDSWYACCKILGGLYLEELGRPDLAVTCFNEFRASPKSGADTHYKLGQAYEQLGDHVRAVRCYENVEGYDGHPLAPAARDALYRLKGS
jgi:tetratricopeptide (TPR) repeat protein